uniref:Insulin-like domain-containing protein n=1 Tax=Oreochromis niloticus TaxID=8128 RepID=A0A669BX67_ORENI
HFMWVYPLTLASIQSLQALCVLYLNQHDDFCPELPHQVSRQGSISTGGGVNEVAELTFKDQMEMILQQGIGEQYCHSACSHNDLENYCC